jgi:hypothetical protein
MVGEEVFIEALSYVKASGMFGAICDSTVRRKTLPRDGDKIDARTHFHDCGNGDRQNRLR